ncbi:DUF2971 domain-containing protein, partial [Ruegeria sp. HKCCA5929]|uniref:DUF2971 domain-containing protein n=1 Tax=Ruegeria sp. HKCCA5929 TaxID=2682988 RepID=UPI0014894C61
MSLAYKYRSLNSEFHTRCLTHGELFFAPPATLNDLYEGVGPFAATLGLDADPQKVLDALSKELGANLNISNQKVEDLLDFERALLSILINRVGQREFFRDANDKLGVLSLSRNPTSMPMWAHYANSHDGFCLGIDPDQILNENDAIVGFEVIYDKKELKREFTLAQAILGHKFREWAYEAEYRMITGAPSRILTLEPHNVQEVIFGARVSKKELEKYFEIVSDRYPHASVKLASANYEESGLSLSEMSSP